MLLYEKNGEKIDVYTFTSDKEKMVSYKKNCIEQSEAEKFIGLETVDLEVINAFKTGGVMDCDKIFKREYGKVANWVAMNWEPEKTKSELLAHREILKNYIDGMYSEVVPTTLVDEVEYPDGGFVASYLPVKAPEVVYSSTDNGVIYGIKNVIKLPAKLCALQLLLTGNFEELLNCRFLFEYREDPIQLFQIEKNAELSMDSVHKLFEQDRDNLEGRIETTSKIIQKVKASNNWLYYK